MIQMMIRPLSLKNDSNAAGKAMKVWGYIVLGAEMKKYEDLVFGIKANTGAYGYIDVGGSKIVFADGNSNATQVISEGKTVKLEKGKNLSNLYGNGMEKLMLNQPLYLFINEQVKVISNKFLLNGSLLVQTKGQHKKDNNLKHQHYLRK